VSSLRVECRYCPSVFLSSEDLESHEQLSHNICSKCNHRFSDWSELKYHFHKHHCAYVCDGCDGIWNTAAAFKQHEVAFNVCKMCERHFDTPSNLIHVSQCRILLLTQTRLIVNVQHELTHRKPMYACLACTRDFTTYGGMIIHLESGACPSQIQASDLAYTTAICFQGAKFFIYKQDQEDIKQGVDLLQVLREQGGSTLIFCCPTCNSQFPKLSSMFMHVESPACSQQLGEGAVGKLQTWLCHRHG
jgi:hypothetical protein